MCNKVELERQIADMEQKLQQMREELNAPQWEPEGGDWYIYGSGVVCEDASRDSRHASFGTSFKTQEAAERAAVYYRMMHRMYCLAEEFNATSPKQYDGFTYELCVDYVDDTVRVARRIASRVSRRAFASFAPTFNTEALAEKALKILNKDIKAWLELNK